MRALLPQGMRIIDDLAYVTIGLALALGAAEWFRPRAARSASRYEQPVFELEYPFCAFCEPGVVGDDDERRAVRG